MDGEHNLDIPKSIKQLNLIQSARRKQAVNKAGKSKFLKGNFDNLDLDNITEPEEWSKIPILDKEQLRSMEADVFYNDFCICSREDVSEFWRSGGSTGKPLFYPRTAEDIRYGMIGFKRALNLAGIASSDIAHMSLPLGIHPAGHMTARAGSELGVGVVWAGGGNTLPSGAQLDLIRMFKPSAWIGMASYGIQLANLAKSEGFELDASSVEKILCSAEPLSNSKREKLSSLWGAPVRDCYGMTEAMMLGCEDDTCDGFRFWSDYCFPEVLNEDTLEPVADGEPGLLVVTSLVTNNATPFIRWNSGDVVTMRQDVYCDNAYKVFPLIKHTHRTAGFVKVRGNNIGFTDLEDLMFGLKEVSDFRVEIVWQNDRDELDVFVELADITNEEITVNNLKDMIQRTFGLAPRIRIGKNGEIAKAFEGAFKPVRVQDLR